MGAGKADEYRVDRRGWPSGPWDGEPDKVVWRTAAGLPGMLVRTQLGNLCGYVAVADGHPAYGKHYHDVDVNVHGGLTYSNRCAGAICHLPEPGKPGDVWWLGFDCAHAADCIPFTGAHVLPESRQFYGLQGGMYRGVRYVRAEVESLAEQLAAMGRRARRPSGNGQ